MEVLATCFIVCSIYKEWSRDHHGKKKMQAPVLTGGQDKEDKDRSPRQQHIQGITQ